MYSSLRKRHPLLKIVNGSFIDLPTPLNISSWWNFGSLLGMCLGIQLVSGILISMGYSCSVYLAFLSVIHITCDIEYGWLVRMVHANGASLFFLFLYLHMGRGMYYGLFRLHETWSVGMVLFILTMATAFFGYVLPWGQMSFWGATVITNLFSAVPYIGTALVEWLWGGFAVGDPTLTRFYSLHFLLPFVIVGAALVHLLFLHGTGSSNPLGVNGNIVKVWFHPYHSYKDGLGVVVVFFVFLLLVMLAPNLAMDPENCIPANPLSTPAHIKPEWYFLWLYAILRSIPNKLGGVVALALGLLSPLVFPLVYYQTRVGFPALFFSQILFWWLVVDIICLTWIGGLPVELPYSLIGQVATVMFFVGVVALPLVSKFLDEEA